MIESTGKFNFACVGCGKCCDSPPQLSIREMYQHLDDFVLYASILSQPAKVSPKVASKLGRKEADFVQLMSDRLLELGAPRFWPQSAIGGAGEHVATVSGASIPFTHVRRCTALLDDNRCGIYETRPNTCRYVPAQHLIPRGRQEVALAMFQEKHVNDCDFSSGAPLILDRGSLVDPAMLDAFSSSEDDDRMDGDLLTALLDAGDVLDSGQGELSMEFFLRESVQQGEAKIPVAVFTLFMTALKDRNELPGDYVFPSAVEVAARQMEVCKRGIERNVASRNKDARSHTESLRMLLALNKAVVDELQV